VLDRRRARESGVREGTPLAEECPGRNVKSDGAGRSGEVLVVDDDAGILRLVQEVLEEEGYRVTPARGLGAALTLLEEQHFGLVVTDLFGGPGQALLGSIERLVTAAAPAPVGVLTAWPVEEQAAQASGVAFVVRKPFDLEELVEVVEGEVSLEGARRSRRIAPSIS
jgi:DNA-binding NtrC family response regulator